MRLTCVLEHRPEKDAMHSYRYFPLASQTGTLPVSSIYILKTALPKDQSPPARLVLTLDDGLSR